MPINSDIILNGNCEEVLTDVSRFPDESVDLVVTSPPYSDRRQNSYGGIAPNNYVEWFLPISAQLHRILKPTGSLVINIKEHVKDGERLTYVIEMILEMRRQGWKWTEEYCWYKKTCFPGKWPNRFRDSFERCLHFTKQSSFYMDQDSVRVPIGDWSVKRFKSMGKDDFIRYASQNNEHLKRKVSNWLDRQTVYPHNVIVLEEEHYCLPNNVLEISPVTDNKNHSACFPIELPTWFIQLLSPRGGIVLDPFCGVGTTALACILLGRHFIGIDKEPSYVEIANDNILDLQNSLNNKKSRNGSKGGNENP